MNREWNSAKIIIRSIVEDEKERAKMVSSLNHLAPQIRIKVETEVIIRPHDKSVTQVMHERSQDASAVFLGLMEPKTGKETEYAERLIELADGFNTTIFVRNAGEFAGSLV